METDKQSANSQVSAGVGFYANGDARFVSQNVRDIGSQFQTKMSRIPESQTCSQEGFAFEYFDAMEQQIGLGGRFEVEVREVNIKNSSDIHIKSRDTGRVVREQQLKRSSCKADEAARTGNYGKQEIRTPKEQSQKPKNPKVQESNVSASEVTKGVENPNQAINNYRLKAAMTEIGNAAVAGAITGAIAATLISGLEHFLAVERGEIDMDQAIATVFINAVEGAATGAMSSGAFAAIPAFIPALIPVLSFISVPLLAVGAFQLVNQVGQIIDRHEFVKRNALLEKVHQQEAQFFDNLDKQVMDYLCS